MHQATDETIGLMAQWFQENGKELGTWIGDGNWCLIVMIPPDHTRSQLVDLEHAQKPSLRHSTVRLSSHRQRGMSLKGPIPEMNVLPACSDERCVDECRGVRI
jgi:hypothetical protein